MPNASTPSCGQSEGRIWPEARVARRSGGDSLYSRSSTTYETPTSSFVAGTASHPVFHAQSQSTTEARPSAAGHPYSLDRWLQQGVEERPFQAIGDSSGGFSFQVRETRECGYDVPQSRPQPFIAVETATGNTAHAGRHTYALQAWRSQTRNQEPWNPLDPDDQVTFRHRERAADQSSSGIDGRRLG